MIRKNNQGFSLVELVVVIAIIGILAAAATAKLISISTEARTAVLLSVKGNMRSVSDMVYAKSAIAGTQS